MLAKRSGVSLVALARLESNVTSPRMSTVLKIKAAIQEAGIQVIEGQPAGGFTLQVSDKAGLPQRAQVGQKWDEVESSTLRLIIYNQGLNSMISYFLPRSMGRKT